MILKVRKTFDFKRLRLVRIKIPKEEYINRTFRLRKELVDQMEAICNEKTSP